MASTVLLPYLMGCPVCVLSTAAIRTSHSVRLAVKSTCGAVAQQGQLGLRQQPFPRRVPLAEQKSGRPFGLLALAPTGSAGPHAASAEPCLPCPALHHTTPTSMGKKLPGLVAGTTNSMAPLLLVWSMRSISHTSIDLRASYRQSPSSICVDGRVGGRVCERYGVRETCCNAVVGQQVVEPGSGSSNYTTPAMLAHAHAGCACAAMPGPCTTPSRTPG